MWCCSPAEAEAEAHAQQGPPSGNCRPKSSSKDKKQPAESPGQAEVGLMQVLCATTSSSWVSSSCNLAIQDAAAITSDFRVRLMQDTETGVSLARAGKGSHAAGCHGHRQQGPLAHWRTCAQEAESLESLRSEQSRWATPPDQLPCGAWPVVTKPYFEAAVSSRHSYRSSNSVSQTRRATCIFCPLQVLLSPLACQHLSSSPACQSPP